MKIYRSLLLLLLLFPLSLLTAQPREMAGVWKGVLTQDAGGYAAQYVFALELEKDTNCLVGKSVVQEKDIRGEMELIGLWDDEKNVLTIREFRVLQSLKPDQLEWCYKTAELRLYRSINGNWRLEGPWTGVSPAGGCIPGWIRLEKVVPRP